ncbi:MAG: family 1 glycosylhydrolase [Actinomycetaceae bacterium]|nr:family 1 glycosylhydrolase [Actinomycetaceae bacterium]
MATLRFPTDFTFGAATAAYQIEGASTEDGRRPSIWDHMCTKPGAILDGSDGSIACDHYHRTREDVALMREMNLETYRFSTSWARVCPDGGPINRKGVDFYSKLVDQLLEAGIKPWLTLYHWDLPQALEEKGGWANRDTAHRFADYAHALANIIGERVPTWTTLNEPWCSAFLGYASGEHAPGRQNPKAAVDAAHHLLLAHGLGVQALRAASSNLTVGITTNHTVAHPADPENPNHQEAARRVDGAFNRIFLDPLFKGKYPDDVLNDMSEAGLGNACRDHDMEIISTPIDVLGVNFYNGAAHALAHPGVKLPRPTNPAGLPLSTPFVGSERVTWVDRGLPRTHMGWEVNAEDLRLLLQRLHRDYTGPAGIPMVITENGAAYQDQPSEDGYVDDSDTRLTYIRAHLKAVHEALSEGVDVRGYLAWSLMDNFEWAWGYTRRFGLVRVDYETGRRTPKASAKWFAQVARSHELHIEE